MTKYFYFHQGQSMDKAIRNFWQEERRLGLKLTAFDSTVSGDGECRVSNTDEESQKAEIRFEDFLKNNELHYIVGETPKSKRWSTGLLFGK